MPPTPTLVHAIALVVAGFAWRALLLWRFPAVFGGDSILRMANPEHVLLSYQLPLPQVIVHVLHPVAPGPLLTRLAMSLVGAVAALAVYFLLRSLTSARAALAGALFFNTVPLIVTHSTVPYQEIFMLGGVLGAFHCASTRRWYWAAVLLAAACLARYESWIACPMVAIVYLRDRGWSARHVAEAAALFGAVPMLWIAFNAGLTPAGSAAIESRFSVARFWRWLDVASVTVRGTPIPVGVLAAIGAWFVWRGRLWRETSVALFAAFVAVFIIALLFSAHGVDPDPERFVTSRSAHATLAAVVCLAAIGLSGVTRYQWSVILLCVAVGGWATWRSMRELSRQPGLDLSVAAARYLDDHVRDGERAVVLAAPIDGVERYLDNLVRRHGARGRDAGIGILTSMDTRPPGYQRILVHSKLGKRRLGNFSSLIAMTPTGPDTVVPRPMSTASPEWIVLWSDFRPTSVGEERLAALVAGGVPAATWSRDSLAVAVYEVAGRGRAPTLR
jgi:hypothetical protein